MEWSNRKYVFLQISLKRIFSVSPGEWSSKQVLNNTVQHWKDFIFFLQFCSLQMKYGVESDLGRFTHKFFVIICCFHPAMSIRFSIGLHLKYCLKFLLFEPLRKTNLWNLSLFRGLNKALCAVYFFGRGSYKGEVFDVSKSPYIQSHTFTHFRLTLLILLSFEATFQVGEE